MTNKLARLAVYIFGLTLLISGCANSAGPDESATEVAVESAPTAVAGTTASSVESVVWVDTSPRLALPSQSVLIMGQGFAAVEPVDVLVKDPSGQEILPALQVSTDLRGGLPSKTTLQLPAIVVTGTYAVTVKGQSSGREGSTSLWVRTTPPAIELNRATLHPQDLLTIDGRGFVPRERVVIYFAGRGGDPLSAATADQSGNVHVTGVPIPVLEPGDWQIIATGAISMGQASSGVRLLPFEPVVAVSTDVLPPGAAAGFFGSGFASNDDVVVNFEGSDALPVTLTTDGMGRLNAPQAFTMPNDLKGQQTLSLSARKTGKKLRVTIQVVPGYPIVELSSTAAAAGSKVGLAARGLRPRERVDVYLIPSAGTRKKLASFRADENGWLRADAEVTIPPDTQAGLITIGLDGEAARPAMRVRFTVAGS